MESTPLKREGEQGGEKIQEICAICLETPTDPAEAAAVEAAAAEAAAERAAVRLPLPAPVGISVPPMPRVPASLQRGRGQGRGRPQGSKSRGPPSLHQNAVKARKCRKERAHNNSSERRCSLVRVLGRSRTCVLPQCSFNARPRRNTLQIHHTREMRRQRRA